jgi:hypothetical protein
MAKPKSQIQKFREAARAANADRSEEHFDATLKRLAKQPRQKRADAQTHTNKDDEK